MSLYAKEHLPEGHPKRARKYINGDVNSSLIRALQAGVPPDFDVYDAATWSAVTPLSEKSVADRSRPVDFPDFTRGKWRTNPPVRILGV